MNIRLLAICFSVIVFLEHATSQPNYARYVNPFIGTGGHGHTFPGALLPFGMVQLSPDTRADDSWDGCSDWGDILLMPVRGNVSMENKNYASSFQHKNEMASPGFYQVLLDKHKVKAELTSTLRTGIHRTFSELLLVPVYGQQRFFFRLMLKLFQSPSRLTTSNFFPNLHTGQ